MKKLWFLLLLAIAATANGQSLKELLYGGKLKNDTGVIRKTDDLSAKIDTSTRKPVDSLKEINMASPDSSVYANPAQSTIFSTQLSSDPNSPAIVSRPAPKNNEEAWKYYMDDIMADVQNDLNNDKKIKSGTYQVFVQYDIDMDGSVRVRNVIAAPSSDELQKHVTDRINQTAPRLKPVLNSAGQPRKMLAKYNFTITKK